MSEEEGYDPNWWQADKALSLARKARQARPAALAKAGDAFLIVTEGKVTEPVYFEMLRCDLKLRVVSVKEESGDHSDLHHVILTAERLAKEQQRKARKGLLGMNEPAKFDHVWAVVDTDVAVANKKWNEVQHLADAKKVRLAHSTPCFEFWLLLHIIGFTTRTDLVDGDAAKNAVRKTLGRDYSTNKEIAKEAIASFCSKWPDVVGHAEKVRRYHEGAQTPKPANPSTEVDRLVRALNDSALAPRNLPCP